MVRRAQSRLYHRRRPRHWPPQTQFAHRHPGTLIWLYPRDLQIPIHFGIVIDHETIQSMKETRPLTAPFHSGRLLLNDDTRQGSKYFTSSSRQEAVLSCQARRK